MAFPVLHHHFTCLCDPTAHMSWRFIFFACSSCSAFSLRCMTCCDLMPMMPPPHRFLTSALSLNCALKLFARVSSSFLSSCRTVVRAMHEAFFLCTSWPKRLLPLMMQYGTSFFL